MIVAERERPVLRDRLLVDGTHESGRHVSPCEQESFCAMPDAEVAHGMRQQIPALRGVCVLTGPERQLAFSRPLGWPSRQAEHADWMQLPKGADMPTVVGVPKVVKDQERRGVLQPEGVAELIHHGHEVVVEAGAGVGCVCADADYAAVAARIADGPGPVSDTADLIVKVVRLDVSAQRLAYREDMFEGRVDLVSSSVAKAHELPFTDTKELLAHEGEKHGA
jgi:alanine dehydrogenase/PNT-like protein